jgi:SAM-dependent methyltransferase
MTERAIEQAEYDRRWSDPSGSYGSGHPGYSENFVKFMGEWINRRPADKRRALDVGCGDGYFTSQLIRLGCTASGIDLSPVAVELAGKRNPTGAFQTHDLTLPFPFPDASFDVVWCSEVLEHLFSPLFVLEQVHRVLKPGGILLATTPAHGTLKNLAIALFAFERHYDPEYPHIRFFTTRSLGSLARKAGLETEWLGTCGSKLGLRDVLFPTNNLMVARKPTTP